MDCGRVGLLRVQVCSAMFADGRRELVLKLNRVSVFHLGQYDGGKMRF